MELLQYKSDTVKNSRDNKENGDENQLSFHYLQAITKLKPESTSQM